MDKIFQRLADALAMDEETWQRHMNPLSFWTRLPILPLVALAVWARVWIGWWCLLPVLLLIVWAWVNPRAFSRPKTTQSWICRSVMGERVLLARSEIPIPAHHVAWANGLSLVALLGLPPLVWGLWILSLPWVLIGLVLAVGAKLWFLDRMVWLYEDMVAEVPEYAAWRC